MSTLTDLILDLIGAGTAASSDRGVAATFAAGSVALASATVWLLLTSPNPFEQPEWGVGVPVGSVLIGACGLLVSILHLRRNDDQVFGLVCLTASATAVAIPTLWIVTR